MTTFLFGELKSEFLATPTLVRLIAEPGRRPAIAVKCSALQLRYFLTTDSITITIVTLKEGQIIYALAMPDQPVGEAFIWSVLENEYERESLRLIL